MMFRDQSMSLSRVALQRSVMASAISLALVTQAEAATIHVDGETCTLIDAITSANENTSTSACIEGSVTGVDTIVLQNNSIIPLSSTVSGDFFAGEGLNGLPSVRSRITIQGSDSTITRLPGPVPFRIFHVAANGNLSLVNLTVSGGDAARTGTGGAGGGLFNQGTLTLSNSTISGNIASTYGAGSGGGLYGAASSTTTLRNSSVSGNTSDGGGGGLYIRSGILTLYNSTVSGNKVRSCGGGLYNESSTVTLDNSMVFGNTAGIFANSGRGGGFCNRSGSVTLNNNSVVSGNFAGDSGGGMKNSYSSTVIVDNSVVSGNSAGSYGGGVANLSNSSFRLISNSVISDNRAARGAGLYSAEAVAVLSDSTVSGNSASLMGGGLVNRNNTTATLVNMTLSGNFSYTGGGIYSRDSTLSLNRSTVSSNSSSGTGGGLYNRVSRVTLGNSTVSGNKAWSGGGLHNFASILTLSNSTVTGNSASWSGGNFSRGSGVTLRNSIIANRLGGGQDCYNGLVVDGGSNWFEDGSCTGGSDAQGDPMLGPLADNGGPTQTHALLEDSGAVDTGNNAVCATAPISNLDQRGEPRTLGERCDIGAFERREFIQVDGSCSLIEAIESANSNANVGHCPAGNPDADTIRLQNRSVHLFSASNNSVMGQNALPVISSKITIQGNGSTIGRDTSPYLPAFRVFHVNAGGNLALYRVTVAGGLASHVDPGGTYGGGILNLGAVTLSESTLSGNSATWGGGLYSGTSGTSTLIGSTVAANTATYGGGLHNHDSSKLTLKNSTVSGNYADMGGGLSSSPGANITLSNSTISENSAAIYGGGMVSKSSTVTLTNVTLSANSAVIDGGGMWSDGGDIKLSNTIVADSPENDDCFGTPVTNVTGNWFGDDSCDGSGRGDPRLGPLRNNGGPTKTHALMAGSGAIDAGDDIVCNDDPVNGLDQRAKKRPVGEHCDAGAYELERRSIFVIPTTNGKTVIFSL